MFCVIYVRKVAREKAECKIRALLDKAKRQGALPSFHVIFGCKICILELQTENMTVICKETAATILLEFPHWGTFFASLSKNENTRNHHRKNLNLRLKKILSDCHLENPGKTDDTISYSN